MKKHTMLQIIFATCLLSQSFAQGSTTFESVLNVTIDKSHKPYKYALLYLTPNKRLALLGRHSLGSSVTILNNKTGEGILCKTTAVRKYSDEYSGDQVVTVLDKPIYVQDTDIHSFTAIFTSNKSKIQLINRTLLKDMVKIMEIDNVIKQRGYLEKLLNQYDEAKIANVYLEILKSKVPDIHHIDIPGLNVNVITYKAGDYAIGPRFIEINGSIMPLSGQCSFLDFDVYRFGSNYFIRSNSGACETGYIIAEVFEIREDTIIKEFSDAGYSN